MATFKRLTDAEARGLTRSELLDRVEAEQACWHRKRVMTEADRAAEREFSRIMHAYLSPQAAMDTVLGRGSDYWDTRPCDDPRQPGAGREPAGRPEVRVPPYGGGRVTVTSYPYCGDEAVARACKPPDAEVEPGL